MSRVTTVLFAGAFGLLTGCGLKSPPTQTPTPPATAPAVSTPAEPPPKDAAKANLRKIGLAIHHYMGIPGPDHFPVGIHAKNGVGLSWRVQILPHLGEDDLFRQFKLDEPWDSEHNKTLVEKMPAVFASPGKPAEKGQTQLRSFVGPAAFMPTPAAPGKPGEAVRGRTVFGIMDGSANTLMVAEAAEPVIWTKPDELLYDGTNPNQPKPLPKLGGVFLGGFHGVTADSQVHWFRDSISEDVLRALLTANGGEVIDATSLKNPDGPPPKPPAPLPSGLPKDLPDATARGDAVDRLHRIHAGLQNFGLVYGHLPTGVIVSKEAVGLSWRVQILAYLEHDNLYRQFKLNEPWNSEHNKKLIDQMPDVFASPGKKAEKGHTFLRTTRGPQGFIFAPVLQPGQKPPAYRQEPGQPVPGRKLTEFVDGTSITITVAESDTAVPWTKPDEMDLLPAPQAEQKTPGIVRMTPPKLGGVFDGGFHALLAEGTVVFYKSSLPTVDLSSLFTVAGGEVVEPKPADHVLYAIPPKK